jgi:SAM-dependent methyltransferase
MAEPLPFERFTGLDYDSFRRMADDRSLTGHERSGFPEGIRAGTERAIVEDIVSKLPDLSSRRGLKVVDIGCGANPLTDAIMDLCREHGHLLTLVDSSEVLAQHASRQGIQLAAGRFPDMPQLVLDLAGSCDIVMAYSVLQFVFIEASVHAFVDTALGLLAPGGRLLIGDLPNASMRRRLLTSEAGRRFHREYTGRDDEPPVVWPRLPLGELDDGVALGLVARARDAGFHAWLVPQARGLPMGNRREDMLCERP